MTGQLMVQVVASAASAAKAARLKRGEGITARRLHLAVERARRGRIEQDGAQNGPFGPGPQ
jgi:hypothetical protein